MLQGIEIRDQIHSKQGSYLSFDLVDILPLIGERAVDSQWRCLYVECTGENAEELHEISDHGRSVSGEDLMRIIPGIFQTIDGQFEARSADSESPWLIIKAIDSSLFEVWSSDKTVLEKVKDRFREVTELPPEAL